MAIHRTPLIATRRPAQVVATIVVDSFTAIPILMADGCSATPLLMLHIRMMIMIVMLIIGDGRMACKVG